MFRRSYRSEPELLGRVFELLDLAFPGIVGHAGGARLLGLDWGETSTPFLKIVDGEIVSHVGVLSMPLIIDGRQVTVAGIHAVCTHPEHRRRGHYRDVMTEAMEWCGERFETAFLFTDLPGLYEPFGFRIVPEHVFVASGDDESHSDERGERRGHSHSSLRKLDWSCGDDIALLRRLVRERTPVSTRLGVASEEAVFAFNAVNLPMWYAAELDAVVSFKQDGRTARIFDVVARTMPRWQELSEFLPRDADRVEICFCPDKLGVDATPAPFGVGSEDCFMVRGPLVDGSHPLMFPRSAEC